MAGPAGAVMGWPRSKDGPVEPSAADLTRQANTCIACGRTSGPRAQLPLEQRHIDGAGRIPLCKDPVGCRRHAEKVGTYCAV